MRVAFLWAGQQFYSLSMCKNNIYGMGKYILSPSFHTVSHIKKASELHKNGKPGNKKFGRLKYSIVQKGHKESTE